jgi:hypothetical protein
MSHQPSARHWPRTGSWFRVQAFGRGSGFHEKRRGRNPALEVHWYLSASLESTEAARRAGAQQANPATATNRTAKPPKMTGSGELSVSHFCATLSKARIIARPVAKAAPALNEVV